MDNSQNLLDENKRLKAENESLYNFFDRARDIQCSMRRFLESQHDHGIDKAWKYIGMDIQRDYNLLTTTLDSYPAFNVNRDQLKDSLKSVCLENANLRAELNKREKINFD